MNIGTMLVDWKSRVVVAMNFIPSHVSGNRVASVIVCDVRESFDSVISACAFRRRTFGAWGWGLAIGDGAGAKFYGKASTATAISR